MLHPKQLNRACYNNWSARNNVESARNGKHSAYLCLCLVLLLLLLLLGHLHPLLLLEQLQCCLLHGCLLLELLLLLHLLLMRLLLVLDRRGFDFGAGCKCPCCSNSHL